MVLKIDDLPAAPPIPMMHMRGGFRGRFMGRGRGMWGHPPMGFRPRMPMGMYRGEYLAKILGTGMEDL